MRASLSILVLLQHHLFRKWSKLKRHVNTKLARSRPLVVGTLVSTIWQYPRIEYLHAICVIANNVHYLISRNTFGPNIEIWNWSAKYVQNHLIVEKLSMYTEKSLTKTCLTSSVVIVTKYSEQKRIIMDTLINMLGVNLMNACCVRNHFVTYQI